MNLIEGSKPFSYSSDSKIGVLIIHGYTGAPGSLLPQAQAFAAAGYNVELPLLPGHGTTIEDMNKTKYTAWIHTIEASYRTLKSKCEKVFIFGLSMGGTLALYLAETKPDVSGIIIVNNALFVNSISAKLVWFLKYFIKTVPGLGNDIKAPRVTEPCYDKNPTSAAHEAIKLFAIVKKNIHTIQCPAIIFKSSNDHVIPVEVAEYTFENIGSADKKMIYLNDSYHVATLDNDSDTICKVAINFIKERS